MDSPESTLEGFHNALSVLADTTRRHLNELHRIGKEDDVVISENLWDTLSSAQRKKLRELKASLWREDPDSPELPGKKILQAMDESNLDNYVWHIEGDIAKCRELAGYGPDTLVCHQALDVFEHEIDLMHIRLTYRLYDWPRSPLQFETDVVEKMIRLLHERKLHELAACAPQPDPDFMSNLIKANKERKMADGNEGGEASTPEKPVWDSEVLVVTFGESRWDVPEGIKGSPSVQILQAFHDQNWRHEVVLPKISSRQRKDALRTLNKKLLTLRFERSNAHGVKWSKIK